MEPQTIPFADFTPMHSDLGPAIREAIDQVIKSQHFICGPQLEAFEKEWASYCESVGSVGVSNGLDALTLILKALDIGAGDEVIVPANTFIATALAVSAVGARPVLVDINENTFNLSPVQVEAAITGRTKAIMLVHLYGQMSEVEEIADLCKRNGLHLIEDAAQAHGARYNGKRAGTYGIAAGFSFYPGKNLGAFGDGGAVVSNNINLLERIRKLRNYGSSKKYHHDELGYNYRLDELQAAILRVKLRHLDRWTTERRLIAKKYLEGLNKTELILPSHKDDESHVWHLFVVRHQCRTEWQNKLASVGVQTLVHYPVPIHLQKAYAPLNLKEGSFPITEELAGEIVSLPLWVGLDSSLCIARIRETLKAQQ